MPDLFPGCPAIAEPIAQPRAASRFIDQLGRVAWADLSAECATARRAAEILACEGVPGASDDEVDALLFAHDIDPAQIERHRTDVLAIAAHLRSTYWAERRREQRRFRNAIASFRNIDMHELVEAGVLTTVEQFRALEADPIRFYQRLDDWREAALFALIEARMPVELRGAAVPFSDGRV